MRVLRLKLDIKILAIFHVYLFYFIFIICVDLKHKASNASTVVLFCAFLVCKYDAHCKTGIRHRDSQI